MRTSVPSVLVAEFDRLVGDEPVLWSGTPHPFGYVRRQLGGVVLGCSFMAFPLTIEIARVSSNPFDLLFLALTCVMPLLLVGTPLYRAWKSTRVCYALTTTRALIVERGRDLRTREFNLARLPCLEQIARRGNRGDIVFEKVVSTGGKGGKVVTDVGFIGLRDYAGARDALERALRRT